jgi:hypothetical protein
LSKRERIKSEQQVTIAGDFSELQRAIDAAAGGEVISIAGRTIEAFGHEVSLITGNASGLSQSDRETLEATSAAIAEMVKDIRAATALVGKHASLNDRQRDSLVLKIFRFMDDVEKQRNPRGRPGKPRTAMLFQKWVELGKPPQNSQSLAAAFFGTTFRDADRAERDKMIDLCSKAVKRIQKKLAASGETQPTKTAKPIMSNKNTRRN